MKRRLKKKYALFTAIIAITAVMAVSLHSYMTSGKPAEGDCTEETPPTPLNHLIENSMSDLVETEKFDAAIRRFMRYWDIKGASFALMKNDSLIYAKGYGYSNLQDSIECEVKNVFRVASVSKLITAVAIMRLCETGKLTTQDQVLEKRGFCATHFSSTIGTKKSRKLLLSICSDIREDLQILTVMRHSIWTLWQDIWEKSCR